MGLCKVNNQYSSLSQLLISVHLPVCFLGAMFHQTMFHMIQPVLKVQMIYLLFPQSVSCVMFYFK